MSDRKKKKKEEGKKTEEKDLLLLLSLCSYLLAAFLAFESLDSLVDAQVAREVAVASEALGAQGAAVRAISVRHHERVGLRSARAHRTGLALLSFFCAAVAVAEVVGV